MEGAHGAEGAPAAAEGVAAAPAGAKGLEPTALAEQVTTALKKATETLGDDSKTKTTEIISDFTTKMEAIKVKISAIKKIQKDATSCPTLNVDQIDVSKLPPISDELQTLLHKFYQILLDTLKTWDISVTETNIASLLTNLAIYLKEFNEILTEKFTLSEQDLCTGIIQIHIVNFILIFSELYFKKIIDGLTMSASLPTQSIETVEVKKELENFQVQLVKTFCRSLPTFKLEKLQFILNRRQGIGQIMDEIYEKRGVKGLIGLNPSYAAVGKDPRTGAPIVEGACSDIKFEGGGKAKKQTRKQKKKKQKLKSGKKNKNKSKRRKGSRKK